MAEATMVPIIQNVRIGVCGPFTGKVIIYAPAHARVQHGSGVAPRMRSWGPAVKTSMNVRCSASFAEVNLPL